MLAPSPPRDAPDVVTALDASAVDAATPQDSAPEASIAPFSFERYRTDGGVEFMYSSSAFVRAARSSAGAGRAMPRFDAPAARSGRAPSMSALLAAARAQIASAASFTTQGAFNALGDGRFVAVLQRTDRGAPRSPTLEVVVASELEGRAQIEGVAEVPTSGVWTGAEGNGCDLSVEGREVRDLDNDGELEIALAVNYCTQPACPTGYVTFSYLAVYDLTPAPRLALMVERRILPQAEMYGTRERRTRWRDVNGDGHPDLVAIGEDCAFVDSTMPADASASQLGCDHFGAGLMTEQDELSLCCLRRTENVLYDPAQDAWLAGGDGALLAEPSPCSHGE